MALCAAALIAYAARAELHVGNSVLWVFGAAACLNLMVVVFAGRPRLGPLMHFLSPLFGLGGWVSLMYLTGGVRSPFVAGLSLEIVLAALAASRQGITLTTAGAVLGLCLQQVALGIEGSRLVLGLEAGFLLILCGLTMYVVRGWRGAEQRLTLNLLEQRRRLEDLEKALQDARTLGQVGERAARLAHGLKNAIHSLRGFACLIQPRLSASEKDLLILDGIRGAIDRLEDLAHTTLASAGRSSTSGRGLDGGQTSRIVDEVVSEVAVSFPQMRWTLSLGDGLPAVQASPQTLREVLTILVRNAAEAMDGRGEVAVDAAPSGGTLEIRVRDHGPGIPEKARGRMFEPGYTTKPQGHGFGLFLARRLVECHGGDIRIEPEEGGGTRCSIELPLFEAPLTS